jgi:hypothetical protein
MSEQRSVFVSPGRHSLSFSAYARGAERRALTCPHCEAQCQAAGRVKNSWYALCRCGTYIQTCEQLEDYYD